jgi:hypothetical protein
MDDFGIYFREFSEKCCKAMQSIYFRDRRKPFEGGRTRRKNLWQRNILNVMRYGMKSIKQLHNVERVSERQFPIFVPTSIQQIIMEFWYRGEVLHCALQNEFNSDALNCNSYFIWSVNTILWHLKNSLFSVTFDRDRSEICNIIGIIRRNFRYLPKERDTSLFILMECD